MAEEAQNEIQKQLESLPPEIQVAIAEFDWASKVTALGQKYGLHVDQMGILEKEILLVLIGLVYPDDFEGELQKRVGLPGDTVAAIAEDANTMIFRPIRENIVKLYDEEFAGVDLENEPPLTEKGAETETANKGEIESREDLLQAVENPPATQTLAQAKLSSLIQIPKQETDYSLTKTTGEKGAIQNEVAAPKGDPYREPIS